MIDASVQVHVKGLTGYVRLDEDGLRTDFSLNVIELKSTGFEKVGTWTRRTGIRFSRGYVEKKQEELTDVIQNRTFRVSTIVDEVAKAKLGDHDGHPIFSVDIHPDGSRFATGGQGSDCGQICIWNMAPVAREEEELSDSAPKLLCQLDNHLACVNCVRWSSDGRHLTSGGDDKVIMIWMIGRVDNTVVIWNAKRWQEMLTVLKGHTGLVKGVSWDSVGKYIASQSDDKSLRVWRTHDWQQECVITEPFVECGGTTHILRLNWSPDGQYLVSAHAMNNAGPTAQIVERDNWRTNTDFVGHRKAVTCVRLSPHIRSRVKKDNKDTDLLLLCHWKSGQVSVCLANLSEEASRRSA
ncbi:hypothetical protein MTO96_042792 [Rhipicephalus appendiculatus]